MSNRQRRKAKARREIARLTEQLRPGGGSSLRSRRWCLDRLEFLHKHLGAVFYAPYWY